MAEPFNCCAATTSETFWQMIQSFKELSLPVTHHIQLSGISPENLCVPILISSTIAGLGYFCWSRCYCLKRDN
ncbi:hypothetical protein GHT06_016667 [Daphnia sinensis]|uniref:Uncharacterized protein n=1 Tax=Daphnia sinensis TaxID=1820382 RepID=A0AAD5PVC3_9CRUS|nr:hypothetical protein GHT06_016667 [Daphnia sinensis]